MKLYVVTMQRWGDPELHSYRIGVFTDKERAKQYGYDEKLSRDNKYEPIVEEFTLNEEYQMPHIKIKPIDKEEE